MKKLSRSANKIIDRYFDKLERGIYAWHLYLCGRGDEVVLLKLDDSSQESLRVDLHELVTIVRMYVSPLRANLSKGQRYRLDSISNACSRLGMFSEASDQVKIEHVKELQPLAREFDYRSKYNN